MRPFAARILISCLLCVFNASLYAHCDLDYPLGGESFNAGQLVTIEWSIVVPHDTENWDLYISYNAGQTWNPLILNLPVDQFTFLWNVPYTASTQVQIRIVQDNIMDIDYTAESDNFTVVVLPQEGPEFTMPAQDVTIECHENTESIIEEWLEEHGGAIASGVCGDLTWTDNYAALSDSCGNTGTAMVVFTVSDDCGINNSTARLTVVDVTGPVIETPASDVTVFCDGAGNFIERTAWLNSHGGATATDDCGDVIWSMNSSGFVFLCGNTGYQDVMFIATDACGNTSTTSARFTIIDNVAPVIETLPQNVVFECDGNGNTTEINQWLDIHGGASIADDCSDVTWMNTVPSFNYFCEYAGVAQVSFVATDGCENSSLMQAQITIEDTTPPVLIAAARDTIIDCEGNFPAPLVEAWLNLHGNAQADDVCGSIEWSHDLTEYPEQCDENYIRTVRFTARDDCGNITVTEATVSLAGSTSVYTPPKNPFNLKAFPNPADKEISITFENNDPLDVTMSLSDVMGKMHWNYSGSNKPLSIPVEHLAPGIYVLNVKANDHILTQNVIVW